MRVRQVLVGLCLGLLLILGRSSPPKATEERQAGRYMRLFVYGGGETITLRDPSGRVAEATDTTAWSRIPACSTGVNPPMRSGDGWVRMDGGFFVANEPLVGTWILQVRRDAPPRLSKDNGPNVAVHAERHELQNSLEWDAERDQAWLARRESITWKVEVKPMSTPADSAWLRLVRVAKKKR